MVFSSYPSSSFNVGYSLTLNTSGGSPTGGGQDTPPSGGIIEDPLFTYYVDRSGPTKTIQEAIDLVVRNLEDAETISQDINIFISEGVYKGFTIPNGSLLKLMGTPYKLNISSRGRFFPTIDFNNSSSTQYVGVDIGAGNPNVNISKLRIQYFSVGIRAASNCHNLKIKDCIVVNNRNAGLFIENSINVQILQNIVVNGDYGIVVRLCKNPVLIHNTVFLNGSLSTTLGSAASGIWCQTAHDYGNGLLDTGKLYVLGNIVWNTAGVCATFFLDDLENQRLVSNFNDFTFASADNYIHLEDRIFYRGSNSRPRAVYSSLIDWKRLGVDNNSISADPKFIQPVKIGSNRNIEHIDLNLLAVSPVLGIVPSFYVNAEETETWLPSYVDSADFSRDILGNVRLVNGTAAGANDRAGTFGFYGQDIFTSPLDLYTKECDIDPLADLLDRELEVWYPKIHKGYFYSNEREYYLYSYKRCAFLAELAVTEFILPQRIATHKPMSVHVNGIQITDPSYLDIIGNRVFLRHKGLEIHSLEEEIDIEAYLYEWDRDGFKYIKTHYIFKFNQGKTSYLLPKEYVPDGPVVITDDKSSMGDPDEYSNREYSVSFNDKYKQSEIVFSNNSNLVRNGQFEYWYGTPPLYWDSSGAVCNHPSGDSSCAFGDNLCEISGGGYIRQTVPITSKVHSLSFHTRGSGSFTTNIEYYFPNQDIVGFVTSYSGNMTPSWTRQYSVHGITGDDKSHLIPSGEYGLNFLGYYLTPDTSIAFADITISNPNTHSVYLDGIQLEENDRPSLYHRKHFPYELTVEYESSKDNYYINKNLAIAPVRTLMSDSFLYIPEKTADLFGGPKNAAVTTLHETRWPLGRKNILPWSRTRGKDKLSRKVKNRFSLIPPPKNDIIAPVLRVSPPAEIRLNPQVPITVRGDSNGIGLSVACYDYEGNPMAHAICGIELSNSDGEFPGWVLIRRNGLKEQLSQSVMSLLDTAGTLSFTYIPPEKDSGTFVGLVPFKVTSTLSYIPIKYPLYTEYLDTITIYNSSGQKIDIFGTLVTKEVYPSYLEGSSYIQLNYSPKFGSVKVRIDNKSYTETAVNLLNSNQFYVDYKQGRIYIKGKHTVVYIEYIPTYIYCNEEDPYKLMFVHDNVFGDYQGVIIVDYTYTVNINVKIEEPGSLTSYLERTYQVIIQNPALANIEETNSVALEL